LTSPAGQSILVDEVRMEIQADFERAPRSGRKRKFLFSKENSYSLLVAQLFIDLCHPHQIVSQQLASFFITATLENVVHLG